MNKEQLDFLKSHAYRMEGLVWDEGLLRRDGGGHTHEVANLDAVHSGRDSAAAYLFGRVTGLIDGNFGLSILKALSKLQVKDDNSERYGGFRWYREESKPIDTNAAFFIMIPLTVIRLFAPETITPDEINEIDSMLGPAYSWFSKECENPILFYTNKIVSDGAMLSAIGSITGNTSYIEQSRKFLNRWLDYTQTRGYGWGENLSLGYNGITLQGFGVIKRAMSQNHEDTAIKDRFIKLENEILNTFRFHDGYEFVPVIRTYNVAGRTRVASFVYNLAGIPGFGIKDLFGSQAEPDDVTVFHMAKTFLIFGDRLYFDTCSANEQTVPRTGITHIMDDRQSYSWLGKNGGIGSINEFPIIKGSYQHKGWGLGWQCVPVSYIVYEDRVAFLRFNADTGDRIRSHPHKYKPRDFLDPALFRESYYPEVRTSCRQRENTVIAIRSMTCMRNEASLITDSLDIQEFKGNHYIKGRWHVLSYGTATVFVTSLMGIKCGETGHYQISIESTEDENGLCLVQEMYNGPMKIHFDDRISAGWIIHYVDEHMTETAVEDYARMLDVYETCEMDGEIPRMPVFLVHEIIVTLKGEELISFSYDPYC